MISLRKSKWYPWLSLLLLAMWIPVQAAGCCKLASVLGFDLASAPETPVQSTAIVADGAMAADHSCCKKPVAASETPAADQGQAPCATGDKGCCLKDVEQAEPGLASSPVTTAFLVSLVLRPLQGETVPVASQLPASVPEDNGPPVYLATLRLLI